MTDEEKVCSYCNGTGKDVPHCPECEGMGWVHDPSDGGTMVCELCQDEECINCQGSGYVDGAS